MKLLGLQFDIAWENKFRNFEKVRSLLTSASVEKGSLVVLPEMFATGFSMNTGTIAEPYGGDTEKFLAGLAKDFGAYVIGGAAMSAKDGRSRNKALCFSPDGKLIAWYAKMRPFTPGGEAEHYTPGERTAVFGWGECNVSPFVCYDLRFPELFRQAAATHRPELFAVIASWPDKRIHHWTRLLQARAIENQAYVIGVNRIGTDPHYEYSGQSAIVDPDGNLIVEAGDRETFIQADLNLENLRKYRSGLPFLADMRKD